MYIMYIIICNGGFEKTGGHNCFDKSFNRKRGLSEWKLGTFTTVNIAERDIHQRKNIMLAKYAITHSHWNYSNL